jgi:hypothetical protein
VIAEKYFMLEKKPGETVPERRDELSPGLKRKLRERRLEK